MRVGAFVVLFLMRCFFVCNVEDGDEDGDEGYDDDDDLQ